MLSTQLASAAARATPSLTVAVNTSNNEGECETSASCTRSGTSEEAIHHLQPAGVRGPGDRVAWSVAPRQAANKVLSHQQVGEQDMRRKQAHQRIVGTERLQKQKPAYPSGSIRKYIGAQEQQHLHQQYFEYERKPVSWSTTCLQGEIFSGLLRLKDGLFLSSPCVADEKGFLEANKVSHIVSIEEVPRQSFKQQGNKSPDDTDSNLPSRSLTLYWHVTEEAGDPVLLETGCTRCKRCCTFPSCYCPSCCCCSHFPQALELGERARNEFCLFAPKPPATGPPALSPQVTVEKRLRDVAVAVGFIDEACEQGGSCLLHSSNELATAAAAAAAYFVIK